MPDGILVDADTCHRRKAQQIKATTVNELGQALKIIFEKVAAFFDIFDLSFFISGALALGAIAFWLASNGFREPQLEGWLRVAILILGSYASGLFCFAAGRLVRAQFERQTVGDRLRNVLAAHGLTDVEVVKTYLHRSALQGDWRLYVRFWAELRNLPEMAGTVNFLNRYWVMAATYDGVAFALIVWFVVLADCLLIENQHLFPNAARLIILTIALLTVVCFREAERHSNNQIEELVAAIAAKRAKTVIE
jgi:hypothetical protein